MQYFKPEGEFFVGDCMPFWDNGTFHLYYLLDEQHHQALGGLGAHQWAHASTHDLVTWQHHDLALPLTSEWEGSIGTGSVIKAGKHYHAFYTTRARDWSQHICHAVGETPERFEKTSPNPLFSSPEGFSSVDLRDPCVFRAEDGGFHMLVTSRHDPFPIHDRGGCILHFTSPDLARWDLVGPLVVPGGAPGYQSVPECSDYFQWNGWNYLIFGMSWATHYLMARDPLGPWTRPTADRFDSALAAVMKTSKWTDGRRVGVFFLASRDGQTNDSQRAYAGNAVFRELVQHDDGELGTRFVPEMTPSGAVHEPGFLAVSPRTAGDATHVQIRATQSEEVAALAPMPQDYRIRMQVRLDEKTYRFGLGFRGSGAFERCDKFGLEPGVQRASLGTESIHAVGKLPQEFSIEAIVRGDIRDVCIAGRRCLINRMPEMHGDRLFLFAEWGTVTFSDIRIEAI